MLLGVDELTRWCECQAEVLFRAWERGVNGRRVEVVGQFKTDPLPGSELCCSKDRILDKVRIMPKVTSKLQLTVPKKIADQYGIRPGDELEWIPAGESIRVELVRKKDRVPQEVSVEERVA